jgi:hypothetical protein
MRAAGGVLTAKQAPHRPGTAPAHGLRAERAVVILPQTAPARETTMSLRTLFGSSKNRPTRAARCSSVFRPRLEPLDHRIVPSFSPATAYAVGTGPQAVVSADFNGDGRLDLATANTGDDTISVLLGNGDGTFQTARTAGPGLGNLAAADFNGDGRTDLATFGDYGTYGVSILLGNGDGTFGGAADTYIGSHPLGVAAGDLNGDGRADLVVTSYLLANAGEGGGDEYDYVNVVLGNGEGTFAPALTTEVGLRPESLELADVNADGKPDVVTSANVGGYSYSITDVRLGNGDGTLQPEVVFDTEGYSSSVAVADFNRDGKPDLAITNGSSVSTLAGNGDGTFGAAQTFAGGGAVLAVADFNGDGIPDLATGSNVLLGNGDGTLQPPIQFNASYELAVAAADFNGDGRPDLAVIGDTSNTVAVFVNDANWPPAGAPSIAVTDAAVIEGNTGTRAITFTVSLSAAFSQPVTVGYATTDGTATSGSDYQAVSGTLTFAPGETSKTISVLVNGDRVGEPNETFVVNLSSPTNATVADGQGVGTILDDEPRISVSDVTKYEGKKGQTTLFTFTVTLSAAYDQAVTMSYRTANGTATSGEDYAAQTGTLTFAPGETTKTITIVVNGDSKKEANEYFYLDLFGNSSNSLFTKSRGTGTILNDD